jgi:hypothetical protein
MSFNSDSLMLTLLSRMDWLNASTGPFLNLFVPLSWTLVSERICGMKFLVPPHSLSIKFLLTVARNLPKNSSKISPFP